MRKVEEQEALRGWRRAQERYGMEGWAGSVMGAIEAREEGRGEGLLGKRIGEVKGLGGC